MKRKEHIVAPENWAALKRNVQGLEVAAKQAERKADTGTKILILDPDNGAWKQVLRERGLRLLDLDEIIFLMATDYELKEQLKGKRFYLGDMGTERHGEYLIEEDLPSFHRLVPGASKDPERNLHFYKGPEPVIFGVHTDEVAYLPSCNRRFYADAGGNEHGPAIEVVVCRPISPSNSV